ncbi:acyl carrier protein [Nocardia sp. NBC_00508]|uniref:hypothetical protein n=1 Tax=Nocardia sp. NBC_00508 TaxID=2975992 RepID=UPI002E8175DC|nr:hypothetical protein [Nocardia sp. NBC_00508]WUD68704.1 acyl carrier protein [Nocardia sp. NBC_00508]
MEPAQQRENPAGHTRAIGPEQVRAAITQQLGIPADEIGDHDDRIRLRLDSHPHDEADRWLARRSRTTLREM